jgi:hypothetical protein
LEHARTKAKKQKLTRARKAIKSHDCLYDICVFKTPPSTIPAS